MRPRNAPIPVLGGRAAARLGHSIGVLGVWPPDGTGDGTMANVTITVRKDGPYLVSGAVELRDADGNVYPAMETVALCRCGVSTKKPFCDGTHSKVGFQAAEQAAP